MENQHRKITGYRDLTKEEIQSINEMKQAEEDFRKVIDGFIDEGGYDCRCLSLAKTNIEQGFMWLIKGIARPTQ